MEAIDREFTSRFIFTFTFTFTFTRNFTSTSTLSTDPALRNQKWGLCRHVHRVSTASGRPRHLDELSFIHRHGPAIFKNATTPASFPTRTALSSIVFRTSITSVQSALAMRAIDGARRMGDFSRLRQVNATVRYQPAINNCSTTSLSTSKRFSSFSNVADSNVLYERQPFWQAVERWKEVSEQDFLSYKWQTSNNVERKSKLLSFLDENIPPTIPTSAPTEDAQTTTKSDFLLDVEAGMKAASMAVRLTPYTLSIINWADPINDPFRRQFIPLKSTMVDDHGQARLDSLGETHDSPVKNLVHRYPDKVLFLATSVCPVYCRFCTRSYAIGGNTEAVTKASIRSGNKTREAMFQYIEDHPVIQDVVVSGGDSYYLSPSQLRALGERLLSIPHIKRIRIATKGLAICPSRIVDPNDAWADALIELSDLGRATGKEVALHTHFNHQKEVTWISELAARKLFKAGVMMRNQTVLLRGVNDSISEMSSLIRSIADINVHPYYVYQGDMVPGLDDLRTPLSTIISLEKQIRGTIAGFMTPTFVVDLPGGGGKRPVTSYESYDQTTGVSKWKAPAIGGDSVFEYHDPRV